MPVTSRIERMIGSSTIAAAGTRGPRTTGPCLTTTPPTASSKSSSVTVAQLRSPTVASSFERGTFFTRAENRKPRANTVCEGGEDRREAAEPRLTMGGEELALAITGGRCATAALQGNELSARIILVGERIAVDQACLEIIGVGMNGGEQCVETVHHHRMSGRRQPESTRAAHYGAASSSAIAASIAAVSCLSGCSARAFAAIVRTTARAAGV